MHQLNFYRFTMSIIIHALMKGVFDTIRLFFLKKLLESFQKYDLRHLLVRLFAWHIFAPNKYIIIYSI